MGSMLFRDPQARSSALAALGTLQPRAFGSLNHIDPLDSVSNYYIAHTLLILVVNLNSKNDKIDCFTPCTCVGGMANYTQFDWHLSSIFHWIMHVVLTHTILVCHVQMKSFFHSQFHVRAFG